MLVKQTDAVRRQSRSRYRRAVPPGARHRSTRRHRTRRTEARPGRGPLAPPLVRPAELLHTQGNRRLDHTGEKRRSPPAPRRANRRALAGHMEAERELPPILQVAFVRDPRGREGWERMSPSRRRMHLLGIFYYRNPEARARRVAKVLQDAAELADRRTTTGFSPRSNDLRRFRGRPMP